MESVVATQCNRNRTACACVSAALGPLLTSPQAQVRDQRAGGGTLQPRHCGFCKPGPCITFNTIVLLRTIDQRCCTFTEKASTRAFSWLKAPTTAFTLKTLLKHYAERMLTQRSSRCEIGMLAKGVFILKF